MRRVVQDCSKLSSTAMWKSRNKIGIQILKKLGRIKAGKAVGKNRNKTEHLWDFEICGALKFVVFFNFAALSILRKKWWQNL